MLIYWNKRNFLHKKRVQHPQDWFRRLLESSRKKDLISMNRGAVVSGFVSSVRSTLTN